VYLIGKTDMNTISCWLQGGLGSQLYQIAEVYQRVEKDPRLIPIFDYRTARVMGQGEPPLVYKNTLYKNLCWDFNPPDILLKGFWKQSPKNTVIKKLNKILDLPKVENNNYVGVHVRRGDLLRYNLPVLSLEYYFEALKGYDPQKVLFFSDDIEYCKTIFGKEFNYFTNQNVLDTFVYLRNCSKIITANSAFSQWAAFLSRAKTVVTPESTKIHLPHWTLLSY
jgi:hypothetical protein